MENETMSAQELIRYMLSKAGMSMLSVSRALGKSDNYLSVMRRNGTRPSFALMAEIASICGFGMLIGGRGEVFEVVPGSFDTFEQMSVDQGAIDEILDGMKITVAPKDVELAVFDEIISDLKTKTDCE